MEVQVKGGRIVVKGTNRKGTYTLSIGSIRLLKERGIPLPPELLELERKALEKISPADISGYVFKTVPWEIQKLGMAKAIAKKRFQLHFECGVGKSKTAIDAISYLFKKGEIARAMVICPLSVISTWRREWDKHATAGKIVSFSTTASLKKNLARRDKLPPETVLLLNYEKVPSCEDALLKWKPDIVVCDESTKCKNFKAKRTRSLARITEEAEYVLELTGTPATQHLIDLFGQFLVLDPVFFGKHPFGFKKRYCVMGGWMGKQIVGYRNEDEIREFLDATSLSARKKDVLELPDKIFQERIVEMDDDQKRLYKEISKKYLVELESGVNIDIVSALSRITKLQELAGGFLIGKCMSCDGKRYVASGLPCEKCERKEEHDIKKCPLHIRCTACRDGKQTVQVARTKVNEVIDILAEIPQDTGAVVWCRFLEEIKMLRASIEDRQVFGLYGEMGQDERATTEGLFREKALSGCGPVWVIQTQTGARGLQLEYICHSIIYSNSFEAELRLQLLDRFHRPGQRNPVTYYEILTRGTVDSKIRAVLDRGKSLNEWVLSGQGKLADIFRYDEKAEV